jgi:anti-sigma regulatory factor (Ser/Thr protein kinase)
MSERSGGEALSPDALSPDALSPDAPSPDAPFPAALPVLPRLRLSACRWPASGEPAAEGGWFDVFVLPGGATALVMGRVQGPGGQAEEAAGRLRAGLRGVLRGGADPADALAELRATAGSPAAGEVTACLAVLNPVTGDLRYATVGQPAPLICAATGAGEPPAGPCAKPPAGPAPESRGPDAGHPETGTAILPSGAVLLLYCGPPSLPDGEGADQESAADAAVRVADTASSVLADPASAAAAEVADQVGPAVLAWLTGDGGAAMVLAARRLPAPVAGWSMDLPADPVALREVRIRVQDWLHELGASPSDRTDVELAVWEAAVNAIVHGRPVAGAATVTVRAALDDAGRAVIQVSDRGRWRPPGTPAAGRRWPGGQGLLVIRQAADELDIAPGPDGTTVTIRRSLSRPVPAQPPGTGSGPGRGVSRDCCTSR